ncbi:MAG TPA: hypothetical protein VI912_05080 [Candidatus Bilamarchaeaceae archaeon]|nr:hypothetical protein [Candidatus Bilamarchaeaceae archaeon]
MLKRPKINKHEIIADAVFVFVSMVITFSIILIFDTHWSFYPENMGKGIQFIFMSPEPYLIGVPIGGLVGLFLFKLIFYAFSEEEKATKKNKKEQS